MVSQETREEIRPLVAARVEAKKEVEVAFVATKLVLNALVVVALVEVLFVLVSPVKVARVPKRLVMVPVVAERTEEKKEVVVAFVVVLFAKSALPPVRVPVTVVFPATVRRSVGVVVPRPNLPSAVRVRYGASVEEAIWSKGKVWPAKPVMAKRAKGEVVPIPTVAAEIPSAPSEIEERVKSALPSKAAVYAFWVPMGDAAVTPMSVQVTRPESGAKAEEPSSRLAIEVTPEERS